MARVVTDPVVVSRHVLRELVEATDRSLYQEENVCMACDGPLAPDREAYRHKPDCWVPPAMLAMDAARVTLREGA